MQHAISRVYDANCIKRWNGIETFVFPIRGPGGVLSTEILPLGLESPLFVVEGFVDEQRLFWLSRRAKCSLVRFLKL